MNIDERMIPIVAKVAHEVNMAYCQSLGDDSQAAWDKAPNWQRKSARECVKFHLENPNAGPESSHENWCKQKLADGWIFGKVKSERARLHPCLVDFNLLPKEEKAKDYLFRQVVHSFIDMQG